MPDQAAGLRNLFARRRPSLLIVAGTDACKAAVAVHFARDAAAGGRATVLIDGTAGQLAAACGVSCRYELSHVLAGDVALGDVLRPLTPHLLLLPAARALSRFESFSADESARLADAFSTGLSNALRGDDDAVEAAQIDLIVVHSDDPTRALDAFGHEARIVVVASPTPSSLRAAYADVKRLAQHGIENFEIVEPTSDAGAPSGVAFANLAGVARRFLEIDVTDGGVVVVEHPASAATAVVASRAARAVSSTTIDAVTQSVHAGEADESLAPPGSPTHSSDTEVSYAAAVA